MSYSIGRNPLLDPRIIWPFYTNSFTYQKNHFLNYTKSFSQVILHTSITLRRWINRVVFAAPRFSGTTFKRLYVHIRKEVDDIESFPGQCEMLAKFHSLFCRMLNRWAHVFGVGFNSHFCPWRASSIHGAPSETGTTDGFGQQYRRMCEGKVGGTEQSQLYWIWLKGTIGHSNTFM